VADGPPPGPSDGDWLRRGKCSMELVDGGCPVLLGGNFPRSSWRQQRTRIRSRYRTQFGSGRQDGMGACRALQCAHNIFYRLQDVFIFELRVGHAAAVTETCCGEAGCVVMHAAQSPGTGCGCGRWPRSKLQALSMDIFSVAVRSQVLLHSCRWPGTYSRYRCS